MTILGSGKLSVWTAPLLLTNTENLLTIFSLGLHTLYTTVRTPTRSDQRRSLVVSSFATFAKIFYYDFCKNSFEVFLAATLLQHTYMG